jgi:hypothetical protein
VLSARRTATEAAGVQCHLAVDPHQTRDDARVDVQRRAARRANASQVPAWRSTFAADQAPGRIVSEVPRPILVAVRVHVVDSIVPVVKTLHAHPMQRLHDVEHRLQPSHEQQTMP